MAQDTRRRRRTRPRTLIRVGVPLATLLLGLVLLEFGLRAALAPRPLAPHYIPDLLAVEWLEVPGGGRGFRYRPGQEVRHCFDRTVGREAPWDRFTEATDGTPLGCVDYGIGDDGFRIPTLEGPGDDGAPLIAVLGDSFTFGDAVPAAARFTQVLAQTLAERGLPVRVANRGLQGLNSAGALGLYRAAVRAEAPDLLVLAVVLNDAQNFRATLDDAPFARATPWRILPAPWWQRSRITDAVARATSSLLGGSRRTLRNVRESFEGQSGARFRATIEALVREARADGADPALLVFPMTPAMGQPGQPYPFDDIHASLAELAARLDVPIVDVTEAVRNWPRARLWAHPTDPHPSPELQRLAGQHLAEALTTMLDVKIGNSPHSLEGQD